jgi:hypothetical protein
MFDVFKRPHHQSIAKLLKLFDCQLLAQAGCYFGGGTAIVLALGEYRESVDIDFLCASNEGYRLLRNTVSHDLGRLLTAPVTHLRQVRTERDKIFTVLQMDGIPVKVELVREGRVAIEGEVNLALNVPVLSRSDMYTQKLLANADRGLDKSVMSRDIIDLAMMIQGWGDIPAPAWAKAHAAYGNQLAGAFETSLQLVCDTTYLTSCLQKMRMDQALATQIPAVLGRASKQISALNRLAN